MNEQIIQIFTAFIGVIGFSAMFNLHGYKLFINGMGGSVSWIAYLIVFHFSQDKIISCFIATVLIAVLSEILARLLKSPVILFMVPMIVPLIPGSDLYYMMSSLVLKDTLSVSKYSYLLAGEAGAIAFGIILITTITQIVVRIRQYVRNT